MEQFDIHSPQATVKEALWFSARLRLTNDISNRELWAFIREARLQAQFLVLKAHNDCSLLT